MAAHSSRRRRACVGLVLGVAVLSAAPTALAGSYDVVACDAAPGGANNSWVGDANNAQLTVYAQCPSGGNQTRGIVARNSVQPAGSGVGQGGLAWARFDAAPGTSITKIKAAYRFVRAGANGWEVGLSNGAKLLTGCPSTSGNGCVSKGAEDTIAVPNSQTIYIEAFCSHTPCPTDSTGDPVYGYMQASANLYSAVVTLQDDSAPSIGSIGGGLWSDGWKRATQTLAFDASDNSGIRRAAVLLDGDAIINGDHSCDYTRTVPCPQGGDSFTVPTGSISDGAHRLSVQATDAAGNPATVSRDVLIDNSPPGAPRGLAVDAGEGWKAQNSFAVRWSNPPSEGAPIAAATWQLCPASASIGCVSGSKDGANITAVTGIQVPRAGDWALKLWLRDQAGNETQTNAAAPVRLRLDDEAPSAVFAPIDPKDPTRLVVQGSDGVSGIGSGSVEIRPQGSESWTSVPAKVDGGRLIATLPDEQLADGVYELRGHAVDKAGNERTTTSLADGTPMTVTLPVRAKTTLTGGRRRVVKRAGRTIANWRHVVGVGYGRRVRLQGRLVDAQGQPMRDTPLTIYERSDLPDAQWRQVRTVRTSRTGRYRFRTSKRGPARTVRIRYDGTGTIRGATVDVRLRVRASSTIHVTKGLVRQGGRTRFFGTLRGGLVPASGELVELQVLVNRRWQVFATARTNARGRWSKVYRFAGSYGSARYAFRARIPTDPAYPFATGRSGRTVVRVRGP
jgi:5-hydroxyisourate hydrolase-like protein (transthyretin family)